MNFQETPVQGAFELNPDNATKLYVREGSATDYLTLEDDSEIY